jgi:hypothetical protein
MNQQDSEGAIETSTKPVDDMKSIDLVPASDSGIQKKPKRGGGPRTAAGKKTSAKNAVRYGIFSQDPVVGDERLEDWEEHLEGLRASLGPANHYEECLVFEMAMNRWQRLRVNRATNELVAAQIKLASMTSREELENAIESLPEDERRWITHDASAVNDFLVALPGLEASTAAEGSLVDGVVLALTIATAEAVGDGLRALHVGGVEHDHDSWTVGELVGYIEDVAAATRTAQSELVSRARAEAAAAAMFQMKRGEQDRLKDMIRMSSAYLLAAPEGELYGRYEVKLDRAFERLVNMFETSQRARFGTLPAPMRLTVE